jgi:hypothetical protein
MKRTCLGRFVHPDNAVQLYPGENVYLESGSFRWQSYQDSGGSCN